MHAAGAVEVGPTVRAIFSMFVTWSLSGRFHVPSQQITSRLHGRDAPVP